MQFKAISVVLVSLVALAAAAPIRHEPESGMINEVGKRAKPAGYR
jgi:hypothetical protein